MHQARKPRRQSATEPANATPDPPISDWVERAREGDDEAFERIYRHFSGMVFGLCIRMVPDRLEAERLTQDVFVRVWQKLDRFHKEGAFGAWLRRVAANTVIEDRRRQARSRKWMDLEEDPAPDHRAPPGAGVEERAMDITMDLERAIVGLPAGARTAFVLHDVYGYRHREIADMTGVAPVTIRAQLHRARRMLRDFLNDSKEGRA